MAECACEFFRRQPEMHEVAETSSIAFSVFVLSATRLAEVRDWGELCIQRSTSVPSVVQVLNSGLCFCFPFETSVHVADQMVAHVVAYLFRILSAIATVLVKCGGLHAHEVQEDAQTSPTRSTSLRRLRQSPPEVPSGSNGRRDRGPGYGTRWGAEWFARTRA